MKFNFIANYPNYSLFCLAKYNVAAVWPKEAVMKLLGGKRDATALRSLALGSNVA